MTKKEKWLLLPALDIVFPGSLLLAFAMLGNRRAMQEDLWKLGKQGAYLFLALMILLLIILALVLK